MIQAPGEPRVRWLVLGVAIGLLGEMVEWGINPVGFLMDNYVSIPKAAFWRGVMEGFIESCVFWGPLVLISMLQARHVKRYKRWTRNQCTGCGYDLRAHAPGATCPECGTPIPPPSATIV